MNRHKYERRQTDRGLRWRVVNPQGREIAQCESEDKACTLAGYLNELHELRVLLAVAAKQLACCQAAAILRCTEEQVQQKINTCLTKGFRG